MGSGRLVVEQTQHGHGSWAAMTEEVRCLDFERFVWKVSEMGTRSPAVWRLCCAWGVSLLVLSR
jgi:hypothetical protein